MELTKHIGHNKTEIARLKRKLQPQIITHPDGTVAPRYDETTDGWNKGKLSVTKKSVGDGLEGVRVAIARFEAELPALEAELAKLEANKLN